MIRAAFLAAAMLTAAVLSSPLAPPVAARTGDTIEGPESLPDHPGRDETFGYCIGCHSFQVIGRNGMTRERWDDTLTWMTERHNMPAPDPEMRKVLLDYLAAAYPPAQRSNRGWTNPFAPN